MVKPLRFAGVASQFAVLRRAPLDQFVGPL